VALLNGIPPNLIFVVLLFGLMYFMLIRPQQQQRKKRDQMLSSLKKGDKVVTLGGIHGTITDMADDSVTLRIADKVEIKLAKSGVGYVLGGS
jgi:preprotein translocase subunit YajC